MEYVKEWLKSKGVYDNIKSLVLKKVSKALTLTQNIELRHLCTSLKRLRKPVPIRVISSYLFTASLICLKQKQENFLKLVKLIIFKEMIIEKNFTKQNSYESFQLLTYFQVQLFKVPY